MSTSADRPDISQLYGRFERVVKWCKYFIILGLCALMVVVNVGGKQLSTSSMLRSGLLTLF